MMEFAREGVGATPLVAFAMSEMGMPTRVLATASGCVYSYAAPDEADGTAPGQISSKVMRGLYRCEKLKRQSKIYGVIADPGSALEVAAHSQSRVSVSPGGCCLSAIPYTVRSAFRLDENGRGVSCFRF